MLGNMKVYRNSEYNNKEKEEMTFGSEWYDDGSAKNLHMH